MHSTLVSSSITDEQMQDGTVANCTQYADFLSGEACSKILSDNGLTIAQFFAYNPEVGADCSNIWPGYRYCVRTPDSSSTASPTPTVTSNVPGPTFTGTAANCNRYHVVATGDSCKTIEAEYHITSQQFHAWNLAVSADCSGNFWLGTYSFNTL
jgi:LysM repeat protein